MIDLSLAGALRVWERNLRVYKRAWIYALLPNFFEPVFYLLGMGVGLGAYVSGGGTFHGGYLVYIAPGLVAASAMNGASFETTYNVFVKLHFGKLYDAMVATRVNMEDVVLGELLWAITRSLIYGGAFLLITLFFGIPLSPHLIPALLVIGLIGYTFAALGLAFTSVIDTIDLFTYYFTLFLTPSFLFSGIFFPVAGHFPPFLVTVAEWTPLYHAVRLMRGVLTGGEGTLLDAAYLLAFGTIFTVLAVLRMRRRVIN